jgi:superfamily II DNA or RNA helicase
MKTLYKKQQEAHDFFVSRLMERQNTLDSSQMGTGKTVVGTQLARTLIDKCPSINKVAVICPKAVIPSWEREMEESGLEPLFINNVESLRGGKTEWVSRFGRGKTKNYDWKLPMDTLILIDEIHKMKGPWTQNANMLVGLVKRGYKIHGMSGTPCDNPHEMRPLGYMLGLHSNEKARGPLYSWKSWMYDLGMYQDDWNNWIMPQPYGGVSESLTSLRNSMYGISTMGLRISDFPDSFKNNRIINDAINFKNSRKILEAFKDIDESDIDNYIDRDLDSSDPEELMIVKILRARQEAEYHKIPDVVNMVEDCVEEGHSAVVFFNFKDSLHELAKNLNLDYIDGGTPHEKRNELIEEFQNDQSNILLINAATGGTGISLHDTIGNRQRYSFISPSFNAKEFVQVLGRIHRNGAMTDAVQKMLVTNGSIENYVMDRVLEKIKRMETLHGLEYETHHTK